MHGRPEVPAAAVVEYDRVLDAVAVGARQDGHGWRGREPVRGVGLEQVDPPVLAAWSRAADVEPPPTLRRPQQSRTLEGLGSQPVPADDRQRGQTVGSQRSDDVAEPPALAGWAAQTVGQVGGAVDVDGARCAGPRPGPWLWRLDQHARRGRQGGHATSAALPLICPAGVPPATSGNPAARQAATPPARSVALGTPTS